MGGNLNKSDLVIDDKYEFNDTVTFENKNYFAETIEKSECLWKHCHRCCKPMAGRVEELSLLSFVPRELIQEQLGPCFKKLGIVLIKIVRDITLMAKNFY